MSGETSITVVGNLTAAPELRRTGTGLAVANFSVASTSRHFDKILNDWVDDATLFLRCSVWRETAEHVATSLSKGSRVVVQGRLTQRSYDTKPDPVTGAVEKRTSYELAVDEIGVSLRYATAVPVKIISDSQASSMAGAPAELAAAGAHSDSDRPF